MTGRTGGRGGRGAAAGRGSGRGPGPAKGAAGSVGRPTGRSRTAQDGASTTRSGRTGATREAVRVDAPTPPEPRTLRVGFVPGVEPDLVDHLHLRVVVFAHLPNAESAVSVSHASSLSDLIGRVERIDENAVQRRRLDLPAPPFFLFPGPPGRPPRLAPDFPLRPPPPFSA